MAAAIASLSFLIRATISSAMNDESSGSALTFICSSFGVSREDEARERDDDEREEDGREDPMERDEDGVALGVHWAGGGAQASGAGAAAVRREPSFAMWFIAN